MKRDWKDIALTPAKEESFDPIRHDMEDVTERAENGEWPDTEGLCAAFALSLAGEDDIFANFTDLLREFDMHGELKNEDEIKWTLAPDQRIVFATISAAFDAALKGDEDNKNLLIKTYRRCFKKEYEILKRMNTMSASELDSIIDVHDLNDVARVIGIAMIMGIELEPRIATLQKGMLQWWLKRDANKVERDRSPGEKIKAGTEILKAIPNKKYTETSKALSATEVFLNALGKSEDEPEYWAGFFIGDKDKDVAYVAGLLKERYPNKTYTIDEYQLFTLIFRLLRGFYSTTHNMACMYAAAYAGGGAVENDIIEENDDEKGSEDLLREQIQTLERENKRLLDAVESKDKDIEAIADERWSLKKELSDMEEVLEEANKNNTELYRLREYVYGMTEEDAAPKEKDDTKLLEDRLRNKRIVIIGGHENWHRMLREKFPKWKYYGASADPSITLKSLSNADKVFFFTGHLGHTNYYKAVGILKANNLEFGYVSSTNYKNTLKQIAHGLQKD